MQWALKVLTRKFLSQLIIGEIALVVLINSLARLHCQRLCPWQLQPWRPPICSQDLNLASVSGKVYDRAATFVSPTSPHHATFARTDTQLRQIQRQILEQIQRQIWEQIQRQGPQTFINMLLMTKFLPATCLRAEIHCMNLKYKIVLVTALPKIQITARMVNP